MHVAENSFSSAFFVTFTTEAGAQCDSLVSRITLLIVSCLETNSQTTFHAALTPRHQRLQAPNTATALERVCVRASVMHPPRRQSKRTPPKPVLTGVTSGCLKCPPRLHEPRTQITEAPVSGFVTCCRYHPHVLHNKRSVVLVSRYPFFYSSVGWAHVGWDHISSGPDSTSHLHL